jgi:hypothetical protein
MTQALTTASLKVAFAGEDDDHLHRELREGCR